VCYGLQCGGLIKSGVQRGGAVAAGVKETKTSMC
jgi:hypothetical protein